MNYILQIKQQTNPSKGNEMENIKGQYSQCVANNL